MAAAVPPRSGSEALLGVLRLGRPDSGRPHAALVHGAWITIALGLAATDIVHEASKHRIFDDEPPLGARNVVDRAGLDEPSRTLRAISTAAASSRVFVGTREREARSAPFTGTHAGQPFVLELTRDLPRLVS